MATMTDEREQPRPRIGEQLVLCPKCNRRCKAGSSPTRYTYYYCTDPKCDGSRKVTRPS